MQTQLLHVTQMALNCRYEKRRIAEALYLVYVGARLQKEPHAADIVAL